MCSRLTDVSEPVRASDLHVIDIETEVGLPLLAVDAQTARDVERDGHPVTDLHAMNLRSEFHHPTSLLVAEHRAHREGSATTVHLHKHREGTKQRATASAGGQCTEEAERVTWWADVEVRSTDVGCDELDDDGVGHRLALGINHARVPCVLDRHLPRPTVHHTQVANLPGSRHGWTEEGTINEHKTSRERSRRTREGETRPRVEARSADSEGGAMKNEGVDCDMRLGDEKSGGEARLGT